MLTKLCACCWRLVSQAAIEAFWDYWDLTYANISVSKGRWLSSMMTCLQSYRRSVAAKPTPLPAPIGNVALIEKSQVPTLEPAFMWGSSSTITIEEDSTSTQQRHHRTPTLSSPAQKKKGCRTTLDTKSSTHSILTPATIKNCNCQVHRYDLLTPHPNST